MSKKAEKLTKIVDESYKGGRRTPGLRAFNMRGWFNKLVTVKQLKVFSVEVDKRIIEKDDKDEKVIRIKRGATLESADVLEDHQDYIIEDPETGARYVVEINWSGGDIYGQGTVQNTHHHLILEKLAEDVDLRKIKKGGLTRKLGVPKGSITARCSVYYSQKEMSPVHGEDYVESWDVRLSVEGEQDKLFEQVCEFVKERAGPKPRSD